MAGFNPSQRRNKHGEWTKARTAAEIGAELQKVNEKPEELQNALDVYFSAPPFSAEEQAWDRIMDRIYEGRRDYHNYNTPENLDYLIGSCTGDKERIAALVTMSELPFNSDGTITLFRGGHLGGQSWTTDLEWAKRFAAYGFGSGGDKRAGGTEIHQRNFRISDLIVALPWEGEVIVTKEAASRK